MSRWLVVHLVVKSQLHMRRMSSTVAESSRGPLTCSHVWHTMSSSEGFCKIDPITPSKPPGHARILTRFHVQLNRNNHKLPRSNNRGLTRDRRQQALSSVNAPKHKEMQRIDSDQPEEHTAVAKEGRLTGAPSKLTIPTSAVQHVMFLKNTTENPQRTCESRSLTT